jgi:hypothetical protein
MTNNILTEKNILLTEMEESNRELQKLQDHQNQQDR